MVETVKSIVRYVFCSNYAKFTYSISIGYAFVNINIYYSMLEGLNL